MQGILIGIGSALVLALGFFGLRPLLLRIAARDVRRQAARPIPAQWFSLLDESVPAARHLSDEQRTLLLRSSSELIRTRHWEGCQGLALTKDMQVIIAAHACLLILSIPGEPFPGLREILVYPATFVPRSVRDPRKWVLTNERDRPHPELGEAWGNGIIVISWDAVSEGARDPADGHNVVLHEFAHELAYEYDLTPAGVDRAWKPRVANPDGWCSTLQRAYERLCAKVDAHVPSVMSAYGATDLAEFFAVATEVFFERAEALSHEDPELCDLLCTFYRQTPARPC
jgi:MtfA peptidase